MCAPHKRRTRAQSGCKITTKIAHTQIILHNLVILPFFCRFLAVFLNAQALDLYFRIYNLVLEFVRDW